MNDDARPDRVELSALLRKAEDGAGFAMRKIGKVPPTFLAAAPSGLLTFIPSATRHCCWRRVSLVPERVAQGLEPERQLAAVHLGAELDLGKHGGRLQLLHGDAASFVVGPDNPGITNRQYNALGPATCLDDWKQADVRDDLSIRCLACLAPAGGLARFAGGSR